MEKIPCANLSSILETDEPCFQNGEEFIIVNAARGMAMLLTQTCDLTDDALDYWLVSPLCQLEGTGKDVGNLRAGKYANLFYVPPPSKDIPESFVDLADVRQINKAAIKVSDRVASLSPCMSNCLYRRSYPAR